MRTRQAAVILVALMLLSAPVMAQPGQAFFGNLNDVPLMPGLEETPDSAVLFDQPEGRIAESAASTRSVSADDIRSFYALALPQFGWRSAGEGLYARGGEQLHMAITEGDGVRAVRFSVEPR
jgi:hypothetical protein